MRSSISWRLIRHSAALGSYVLRAAGPHSIAFTVQRILVASTPDSGLGGIQLTEVDAETPWVKDYDALKGEGPTRWLKWFDTSNWGLIAAHHADQRIGGAVIAFDTPGLHLLDGQRDLAVLWDLRVRPDVRSSGVGSALFLVVEDWSKRRGCRTLMVETQNINVPACRFYVRMGCTLGAIHSRAYPDLPNETQLLWFKDL
jgi:GNAT superfamily N-acetyltransferase